MKRLSNEIVKAVGNKSRTSGKLMYQYTANVCDELLILRDTLKQIAEFADRPADDPVEAHEMLMVVREMARDALR